MKVTAPFRGRRGSRSVDPAAFEINDSRVWTAVGLVIKSGQSHFEKTASDVHVHVQFQPSQQQIFCRLGCFAGGPGMGLWRIPDVGAEVMVLLAMGRMDFMPTITAQLSGGVVPVDVSDDKTVLVAPDEINLIAPIVKIGSAAAAEPLVKGQTLVTLLTSHFHPTPFGPSGPSAAAWANALSANHKIDE